MAMYNAVLLREENTRLQNENARREKKQTQRRAFIQTGGSMTIAEGIASNEARKTRQKNKRGHREDQGGREVAT